MAAPTEIVTHGTLSEADLVDEDSLLVKSCTVTPTRDEKEYPGAKGEVKAVQYRKPLISFDFDTDISVESGLAVAEPGSEVATLANHTGSLHGFDTTGTYLLKDPVRDLSQEKAPGLKFKVTLYPHLT